MNAKTLQWVAEHLGIPTAFVVVLCAAIYGSVTWTADNVAQPLVDSHLQFLAAEQANMKIIAESSETTAAEMGKQTAEMETHTKLLKSIRDDQRKFPAVAEKMP